MHTVVVARQLVLAPHQARRTVAQIEELDVGADGLAGGAVQPAELLGRRQFLAVLGAGVKVLRALAADLDGTAAAPTLVDVLARVFDRLHEGVPPSVQVTMLGVRFFPTMPGAATPA